MKKNIIRTSVAAMVLVLLGACSEPVKLPPTQPTGDNTYQGSGKGADTRAVQPVDVMGDPSKIEGRVYFDYDSYVVRDDMRPVVAEQAKFLIAHPARHVTLQGNTDERGGSEYNLALGQKRAEAVRQALKLLGVPDSQMEAVSFGKEKPLATGHDEAAWSKNRRVDFAY